MYNERIQYALDNFIQSQYFMPMNNSYHLKEEKESGKSDLSVTISNDNLCIYDFDSKKKCGFVRPEKTIGMNKSVDLVLFEKREEGWRVHLIEMKSSVGCKTWREGIKPKVRTSYLTSLAIGEFLGIKIVDAIAYTTYENEKFEKTENEANPRAMMPQLGMAARDPVTDEWEKDRIYLNLGKELLISHKRIKMTKNEITGILEGALQIG